MQFSTLAAAALILSTLSAAAVAQDFSHSPASPGSWSYAPQSGGSEARFMDSSGTIRLFVTCTRANRMVTLARTSAAPASALGVWTDTAQRNLPARFDANSRRVIGGVNAADSLLDAIAFSRGRIALTMPGSAPLVVTAGPEAARVFEDCRN